MIAYGGPFKGGKTITNLVSLMDLPVTLLDCGEIPRPEGFHGRSLKALAEGECDKWEDQVFIQISESQVGRAIRTKRWKYSVRAKEDGWLCKDAEIYYEEFLYDLEEDPYEQNNLVEAKEYENIRAELAKKLIASMEEAGEKSPEILPWPKDGGDFWI